MHAYGLLINNGLQRQGFGNWNFGLRIVSKASQLLRTQKCGRLWAYSFFIRPWAGHLRIQ